MNFWPKPTLPVYKQKFIKNGFQTFIIGYTKPNHKNWVPTLFLGRSKRHTPKIPIIHRSN